MNTVLSVEPIVHSCNNLHDMTSQAGIIVHDSSSPTSFRKVLFMYAAGTSVSGSWERLNVLAQWMSTFTAKGVYFTRPSGRFKTASTPNTSSSSSTTTPIPPSAINLNQNSHKHLPSWMKSIHCTFNAKLQFNPFYLSLLIGKNLPYDTIARITTLDTLSLSDRLSSLHRH
jgi:hypothetical protein